MMTSYWIDFLNWEMEEDLNMTFRVLSSLLFTFLLKITPYFSGLLEENIS